MRRTRDQRLTSERDAGRIARVAAQYEAHCHRTSAPKVADLPRSVIEVPCELAPNVRRRTVCSVSPE